MRPDARQRAQQAGLAAARRAVHQHRVAGRHAQVGAAQQRLAAGQAHGQPMGLDVAGRGVARQRIVLARLGREAVLEAGQTVGGGLPRGQRHVVVHQPGERVLHPPEGRVDLHQLAELDGAAEVARRRHDQREDDGRLTEEAAEPGQVLLVAHQPQVVGHHVGEAQVELPALHAFAAVQRDGLAVLAHPHHVMAEIGFQHLLLEVELHLWPADPVRDGAAHGAIQHRCPHHVARDLPAAAAGQRHRDGAAERPENAHEAEQGDQRIEDAHRQRHRVAGEEVQVLLDPLVGVVRMAAIAGVAGQFEPVEGLVRQPAGHVVVGHPYAPAQLQDLREVELVDRDHDVDQRQPAEAADLLPEHGLVLVLQRVVEHAVPLVDLHQHVDRAQVERHDGREQPSGFPLLVGIEVGRGQRRDAAKRLAQSGAGVGCGGVAHRGGSKRGSGVCAVTARMRARS